LSDLRRLLDKDRGEGFQGRGKKGVKRARDLWLRVKHEKAPRTFTESSTRGKG